MRDATGRRRLATRWVDRSIRTKGLVVIAVPIAILVVVLGSTFWFTHLNNQAQDVSSHALQSVDAATTLENNLMAAETAVSGYLLTGDPAFQASYSQAQAAVPSALGDLLALTTDNATVSKSGLAIQKDANRLISDTAQLSRQVPGPVPVPAARSLLRFSQTETDQLRAHVATLVRYETGVIAAQRSAIHASNIVLSAITIGAVVLAVAGGVIVSQLFTTGVVTRLRRLERATEALERGEVPQEVPTGQDEIGRLSARLLDTAAQLRERADERDRARRELEDILTASPVVSLRYDVAARRFSYASPNVARLLGISADEALGDPRAILDRLHPDTGVQVRDALRAARERSQDRLEVLVRFRRDPSSDDWREAEAVYTADRGPGGELVGVVTYLVDVSERHVAQRAADERRFLLESIFHASPDTIVVRDIAGRVVLASSALAEVIGAANTVPHELVDEAYRFGRVPGEDRALLDRLIARCVAGEHSPAPVVTTGRLPSGEVRTYETRARPVFDQSGRVTGTVTVSRDVTERVRLEQSLREATAGAERASEAKSEFLSRMSHELRTPLNAILGFAQLLELDDLSEEQSLSVDQIQVAGRHLLALINEVLDISRIEAGRLSLATEPVEVGDVLDEVAALLAAVAEAAQIQLAVDARGVRGERVRADRQRLVQVLLNLGSNAVKYNSIGGSVAFCTSVSGNRIRFEVRDTGPGIPREQQDQLFVPFSRLGAERSGVEGTGVGLALSKQLVEVMGGTIGVESVQGHGSTFWVELRRFEPAADAHLVRTEPALARAGSDATTQDRLGSGPPSPLAPRPSATHVGNGVTVSARSTGAVAPSPNGAGSGRSVVVLHIEDNPSNASLVEQILAKRPQVRLVSAAEGRSGLELARQHRPDLVLLDLHLPDLPGDELLYRLKAVPELADTKVVVVSADATPSRIRGMLDQGVEGYLTKPVDVEALLRLVDHEIGAKQGEPR